MVLSGPVPSDGSAWPATRRLTWSTAAPTARVEPVRAGREGTRPDARGRDDTLPTSLDDQDDARPVSSAARRAARSRRRPALPARAAASTSSASASHAPARSIRSVSHSVRQSTSTHVVGAGRRAATAATSVGLERRPGVGPARAVRGDPLRPLGSPDAGAAGGDVGHPGLAARRAARRAADLPERAPPSDEGAPRSRGRAGARLARRRRAPRPSRPARAPNPARPGVERRPVAGCGGRGGSPRPRCRPSTRPGGAQLGASERGERGEVEVVVAEVGPVAERLLEQHQVVRLRRAQRVERRAVGPRRCRWRRAGGAVGVGDVVEQAGPGARVAVGRGEGAHRVGARLEVVAGDDRRGRSPGSSGPTQSRHASRAAAGPRTVSGSVRPRPRPPEQERPGRCGRGGRG